MKKLFFLAATVLASVSMFAAYAPTADEVIYLQKDAYDASATDAGYSKHAAIAWEGTVSWSDKVAGDPENGGAATSGNVKTFAAKGNGNGKNMTINIEGCSKVIVYHEKQSSRYLELREGNKTGTILATSASNTYFVEAELDGSKSYSIFLHGIKADNGDQDFYVYAVKLIKAADDETKATVKGMTVDGDALTDFAAATTSYNVELPFGYSGLPTVAATTGNGATVDITQATALPGAATVVCTSKDGTSETITYTINFTVATAASTDATLKSLKINGTAVEGFKPDSFAYAYQIAYVDALPVVTAEANDDNVKSVTITDATEVTKAETAEGTAKVVVVAQDNSTTLTYTIAFTRADALKDLTQVKFSNGCDAFIDNVNRTVKAFYLEGTEAPTATTITAGNGTAGEYTEGKIVVTGSDASTVDYVVTLEAVTPNTDVVEESASAGEFTGTEAWVKNGLLLYGNSAGFSSKKYVLRRQLKSSDKADDQRVIGGWVRTYFFVGNASKLELTTSSNKKLKYAIDGGEYKSNEAETLSIALEAGNHMIEIVTDQASGDLQLSAPKLVKRVATAIDNAEVNGKAVKMVENGQLIIIKNGVKYNAIGAIVK